MPPPPSGWTNVLSIVARRAVEERRAGTGPAVLSCGDPIRMLGPTDATADAEAGRRRRVRVDDRRDLSAGRAVEQINAAGPGARGVVERRPDDHVVADPRRRPRRTRAPAWAIRIGDVEQQAAESGLRRVALEHVDLARAAILAGRADHDIRVGRGHRRAELALVRCVGVGDREGRQQVAEGRALGIGVEHVRHAVARPGERAAGRPDHQLVADRRDRRAELVAGAGIRVGEDVDERAVSVGRGDAVVGGDAVVEIDRAG